MGNVIGSQTRRKLGDAIQERVFQRSLPAPLSPEQLAVMDQLTQREQARMKDLPSLEQVNARDPSLDRLLDKLSNSITGRVIDITSSSPQPSSSQPGGLSASSALSSSSRPAGLSKRERAEASEKAEAAMNIGRLPSFILKELFEARNASEAEGGKERREGGGGAGSWEGLAEFSSRVGGDEKELMRLMEHCCLPQVGKVDTFGHQYAFARPPMWWRKGPISGGRYRSEPEEKKLAQEPWEKMIKK